MRWHLMQLLTGASIRDDFPVAAKDKLINPNASQVLTRQLVTVTRKAVRLPHYLYATMQ
ncbi:hypothetical protein BU16DRAFT_224294 [Lophium mytilinum]|uniref:Uncharacterized protein n=1 Tax=Lophium mytilinum TaxID=390894 RepID=A0A6A6QAZ5_9PEZI|nr:hypothetical protein BU16DRAFT_224294 [Lophium mytilinum]